VWQIGYARAAVVLDIPNGRIGLDRNKVMQIWQYSIKPAHLIACSVRIGTIEKKRL
jgi:hypothetical protein